MSQEKKKSTIKKLSVKQARDTAKVIAKIHGLKEEVVFEGMVAEGQVSAGRGCYTEGQEYYNTKYEIFKTKTLEELKTKGLTLVNSKGQLVDVALNHKAVK